MPTFEEARAIILDSVTPLGSELAMLSDAHGRVLGEDITASRDMPLWDNSAMDGYALRSADYGAAVTLRTVGFIAAGDAGGAPVEVGSACKIMTGAPLPPGADAVVPVEETEEGDGWVRIVGPVERGQHIRRRGEDIRQGAPLLLSGTLLRPQEISMLASLGLLFIPLFRTARVAILATGDELVEPGEPLAPGKIVNSNSLALAAAIREIGGEPLLLGIARDTPDSHRQKIAAGLKADALITSAGVSAGDLDLVREILAEQGVEQLFWKVDIKPGRPTAFGMKGQVPVFSLPGNPVSALVTFEEFVRPALLRMMGRRQVVKPLLTATLTEEVRKKPGKLHFLRVSVEIVDGRPLARPCGDQNTGILSTMVKATGLALLPAEQTLFPAGGEVQLHLLDCAFGMREG